MGSEQSSPGEINRVWFHGFDVFLRKTNCGHNGVTLLCRVHIVLTFWWSSLWR